MADNYARAAAALSSLEALETSYERSRPGPRDDPPTLRRTLRLKDWDVQHSKLLRVNSNNPLTHCAIMASSLFTPDLHKYSHQRIMSLGEHLRRRPSGRYRERWHACATPDPERTKDKKETRQIGKHRNRRKFLPAARRSRSPDMATLAARLETMGHGRGRDRMFLRTIAAIITRKATNRRAHPSRQPCAIKRSSFGTGASGEEPKEMTRNFFYFSEMGYNAYPTDVAEQYGYTALLFPNSIFDANKARDLWQMFLREHEYASEVGLTDRSATSTTTTSSRCRRASISRPRC